MQIIVGESQELDKMNAIELRQKKGAKLDSAQALMTTVESRDGILTNEERAQFDALLVEAETFEADAVRAEKLEGFKGVAKPMGNGQFANGRGSGNGFAKTPDTPEGLYCRHLRTGDFGVLAELRAYNDTDMNVTTAADGETLVPVGMVSDIVAKRDEMWLGPKLGIMKVPGKGTTVNYPIDNEADVLFLTEAESATIDQDAPAVTEKAFTLAKYAKYVTLTWEILRDEDVSLIGFLNNWVARGWAATHNLALMTQVLAAGTAGLTLDAAAAIGAAEIPELVGKLLPEYQDGAQWIMHPTTYAYLSGLASTSMFQFAPQPGGNLAGGGQSLWGYPLQRSSHATALAASAKSLVFGNFQYLGYREGTGLTTLRDPYSVATAGQVRLHYWFDLVYGVLQAEAIQYATHPSA
jgi:HK97 family phage major capsid protein